MSHGVDLQQARPRERDARMQADGPMDPADAHGSEGHPLESEHAIETGRFDGAGPMRGDDPHTIAHLESARDVHHGSERGWVQPTEVVDRQQDRAVLPCRDADRLESTPGDRGLVGRPVTRVLDAERDGEGASLRRRQSGFDRRECVRQQVDEARVRQARLGLGGHGRQHKDAVVAEVRDRFRPDRRLAEAGVALEEERGGGTLPEPSDDGVDLWAASDDFGHCPRSAQAADDNQRVNVVRASARRTIRRVYDGVDRRRRRTRRLTWRAQEDRGPDRLTRSAV